MQRIDTMKNLKWWNNKNVLCVLLIGIFLATSGCEVQLPVEEQLIYVGEVPEYKGDIYTVINGNVPSFTEEELTGVAFESYSELDPLGRCGIAWASLGRELAPEEERESISQVTPSGWENMEYEHVSGGYLYNRCHLIGFQLAGENANEKNLITGTQSFNVEGMLPFENLVATYIKENANHVMYRVTPVFEGSNLVVHGVFMEAYSVEDLGEGICFHVFVHNIEEGVEINYVTGQSSLLIVEETYQVDLVEEDIEGDYVLNTNTKKFHMITCSSVEDMSEHNKEEFTGEREDVIANGYEPCQRCNP